MCERQKLSEKFIREYEHSVSWSYVSSHQTLSEKFMREFQHKLNSRTISQCQMLSEEFINEFNTSLNWDNLSEYQVLTESTIAKFSVKINWECYFNNQHSRFHLLKKHITKTDFENVSQFKNNHLNENEILTLQKLMDVKNMFKIKKKVQF